MATKKTEGPRHFHTPKVGRTKAIVENTSPKVSFYTRLQNCFIKFATKLPFAGLPLPAFHGDYACGLHT